MRLNFKEHTWIWYVNVQGGAKQYTGVGGCSNKFHTNCCILHFEIKKFCFHPSTKDAPFKNVEVMYPGAPVGSNKQNKINNLLLGVKCLSNN